MLGTVIRSGGAVEVSAAFADAEQGSMALETSHLPAWGAGCLLAQVDPAQVHPVKVSSAEFGVLHVPLAANS